MMAVPVVASLTEATANEMAGLVSAVYRGEISVAQFEISFAAAIKDGHLASGMYGAAGRENMTQAMWGEAGSRIKAEYEYLHEFATGIADGSISEAEALRRAGMYGNDIRGSYADAQQAVAIDGGMTEERRVPTSAKPCDGCREQADLGWQPIGTLKQIGATDCGSNCGCGFEYR